MSCNRIIAQAICQAQVASDAGKGYYDIKLRNGAARPGQHFKYRDKERAILKALDLITKTKNSNFKFWVEEAPDQNGYDSILVYFEWKGHGLQVSFHNPKNRASQTLLDYVGKGTPILWDRRRYGSQRTCLSLIKAYKL